MDRKAASLDRRQLNGWQSCHFVFAETPDGIPHVIHPLIISGSVQRRPLHDSTGEIAACEYHLPWPRQRARRLSMRPCYSQSDGCVGTRYGPLVAPEATLGRSGLSYPKSIRPACPRICDGDATILNACDPSSVRSFNHSTQRLSLRLAPENRQLR